MQYRMLAEMNIERQFWLDYMDKYDENIQPLVKRLKSNTRRVMEYRHEDYPEPKGLVLAAFNMLIVSSLMFNSYFDRYLPPYYREICPMKDIVHIKNTWGEALDSQGIRIRMLEYKRVANTVSKIHDFIRDPRNIDECGIYAQKLKSLK